MRLPVHAFMIRYIYARFYDILIGHYTWFVVTCSENSLKQCLVGLLLAGPV
jgi:hypothetical protein